MQKFSDDEIKFLKNCNYVSSYELKDLILGYTDIDVLLKPEDLELFHLIKGR